MRAFLRRLAWWWHRRRKEAELREELEFHLAEEQEARRAGGMPDGLARQAARRDLGNVTLLREDTRRLWTWTPLEQLGQDVRYAVRTMARDRAFTALVALSLALGIGANTAIFSFMDAILWRALPVADPAALVALHWRARPYDNDARATGGSQFVLRAINGRLDRDSGSVTGAIFPYPAFERLREVAEPVLSSLFAYHPAGSLNVSIDGAAEIAAGGYVSGGFFAGLGVPPAAGRLIAAADDRPGADAVAVVSMGYSQRRLGGPGRAVGRTILVDNVPFTVVGVAPAEFFGVDPGEAPHVYLPLHARLIFGPATGEPPFLDANYYWLGMMGRLRPGVDRSQAEAALRAPFAQWVAGTAATERERANLPVLSLQAGAGGLDSLRRQYSKPLYVLMAMVALILIVACANTANLLLARATARRREIAVRLSIGASRARVVRQLLTESVLLASLGGGLGILFAVAGIGLLTGLLANGREGFTLHAGLDGYVLGVTLGVSVLCGIAFGLAPAIQATRPALMPTLRDGRGSDRRRRGRGGLPGLGATRALVVAQAAISLLLLVGAGLFVRTLS